MGFFLLLSGQLSLPLLFCFPLLPPFDLDVAELLDQAGVVGTDLVLLEELVELPEQDGTHLFPADVAGLRVDEHALALVWTVLEVADEAGTSAGSDSCLGGDEVLAEQLVGVFPMEMLHLKIPSVHFTLVPGLAADLCDQVVLHGVVH